MRRFRTGDSVQLTEGIRTGVGEISPGARGRVVGQSDSLFSDTPDIQVPGLFRDHTVKGVPAESLTKLGGPPPTIIDPPYAHGTRFGGASLPRVDVSDSAGQYLLWFFLPWAILSAVVGGLCLPPLLLLCGWLGQPWVASHPSARSDLAIYPSVVILLFIVGGVLLIGCVLRPTSGLLAFTYCAAIAAWMCRYLLLPHVARQTIGDSHAFQGMDGFWTVMAFAGSALLLVLTLCRRRWSAPGWIYPLLVAAGSAAVILWSQRHDEWRSAPAQVLFWSQLKLEGYPLNQQSGVLAFFGTLGGGALLYACLCAIRALRVRKSG